MFDVEVFYLFMWGGLVQFVLHIQYVLASIFSSCDSRSKQRNTVPSLVASEGSNPKNAFIPTANTHSN